VQGQGLEALFGCASALEAQLDYDGVPGGAATASRASGHGERRLRGRASLNSRRPAHCATEGGEYPLYGTQEGNTAATGGPTGACPAGPARRSSRHAVRGGGNFKASRDAGRPEERHARGLGRRRAQMPRAGRGLVHGGAALRAGARAGARAAPGRNSCVGLAALDRVLLKNFE
jgi:hypothetical protein